MQRDRVDRWEPAGFREAAHAGVAVSRVSQYFHGGRPRSRRLYTRRRARGPNVFVASMYRARPNAEATAVIGLWCRFVGRGHVISVGCADGPRNISPRSARERLVGLQPALRLVGSHLVLEAPRRSRSQVRSGSIELDHCSSKRSRAAMSSASFGPKPPMSASRSRAEGA